MIDTHAHLNFNAFKDDAKEVAQRSLAGGVWMINVGSQYATSKRALEMAKNYEKGVYAAVGLHPIHLADGIFKTKLDKDEDAINIDNEEFNHDKYKELASSERVVAIGEIGLDYYYRPKTKIKLEEFKNRQKDAFLKQLDLAKELNLPAIIHCRSAHDDLIEILSKRKMENGGVVHCYTGTWEQAQKYLEMGFCLGLNGIIFKLNLDEVIRKIPLNRIVLETDCPYLTPDPMEGRNEPLYIEYVAKKVAQLKNISFEQVDEITTANAKKLFKISS